ncbi:MAG: hypothetical protein Tsb0013_24220 [Phycisphaerales bacterium]
MDLDQRIAQFENMAQADPDNEMAHFSLAGAYAQAERYADSAAAYLRAVEVSPEFSKAYQLAGENQLHAGDRAGAIVTLQKGYEVAAKNGDLMPKRAIAALLEKEGVELPEVEGAAPEPEIGEGDFVDRKTGRPGTQLPRPPFKGPLGQWIYENISAQTWNDWIAQGTKVINELRLDLSKDDDEATYDRYMREFLEITDELHEEIRSGAHSTS